MSSVIESDLCLKLRRGVGARARMSRRMLYMVH